MVTRSESTFGCEYTQMHANASSDHLPTRCLSTHSGALLLFASSWPVLVFAARTFSNPCELVLLAVAISLALATGIGMGEQEDEIGNAKSLHEIPPRHAAALGAVSCMHPLRTDRIALPPTQSWTIRS